MVMLKNMLGIFISIDICTLHRISSKNSDLNICAHTCTQVSVMGHKQGFDLAVPVITFSSLNDDIYCFHAIKAKNKTFRCEF